jgi:hypothetical protein
MCKGLPVMNKETFSASDEISARLQLERWKKAHPGVAIKKETIDKNPNKPIGRFSAPAKPTVTIKIEYE